MMMKINKNAIVQYLLIYLVFVYQGAIIFKVYQDLIIIFTLLISLYIFIRLPKLNKVDGRNFNEYVIFLGGMLVLLLAVWIKTNGSLSINTILNYISRFLIVFVAFYVDKEKFSDRFIKISTFFAVISLIGFALQIIGESNLLNLLLKINPGDQSNSRGMLFYAYNNTNGGRNQGIYGEPGLYQIVLIVTLYMLLFLPNIEKRKLCSIIIIVTMLTTMSATGYFSLFALLIIYCIQNNKMSDKKTKLLIILMFTGLLIFCVNATEDSFIYEKFFNKFIDNSGEVDFTLSTGRARIVGINTDLQIIKDNPMGVGSEVYANKTYEILSKKGLINKEGLSVSGLTRFMALVGIITSMWVMGFMCRKIFKNSYNILDFILKIFIIVNTTLGQPQFLFPALIIFGIINTKVDGRRISNESSIYV